MPYPEGHKSKVRARIIESAARAFRSHGIREISVPLIMKGAGLTHGGFYSHFDNKEQLVAETCSYAIGETIAHLLEVAARANQQSQIDAVIDDYLTPYHRDNPEEGCVLPALSAEISRISEEVRQAYTLELHRLVAMICDVAKTDTSTGYALLSLMVGSMNLARTVNDPGMSDDILASGRRMAKQLLALPSS